MDKETLLQTYRALDIYMREKMSEKEAKGLIISREIVEEILDELVESATNLN